MTEQTEKIIWFIDNDEQQLQLYYRHLAKAVEERVGKDSNVIVREQLALPHKEQYLQIMEDPRTVSILIDQKLNDKGGVDHTGIELAQYLRTIDDIMPIYILTNYPSPDEYPDGQGSVEYVIDKGDIGVSKQMRDVVISRLLRRINVFQKIHTERESRFRELLKKSLNDQLSDNEKVELDELEFARSAATVAAEHAEMVKPDKLDEALQQLQDLRSMIEEFKQNDES